MDLHANAALSWSGRRQLARRVVEHGWTLRAAAEAAGVSVRCARKWAGRYRSGDMELRDRSSAPRRVANRTAPDRVAVIVKLRRLRMSAGEIAETLQMPLSTVSAVLKRNGVGRLGRIGLEPAVRYERSRPAEPVDIDVKKRPPPGRRQTCRHPPCRARPAAAPRRARPQPGAQRLGVCPCRRRRRTAACLRRSARRREGSNSDRLPPPSSPLLRPTWHPCRARPDRQRQRLHLQLARARLPPARHPPPPHPAPPTADQRQS